MEQAAKMEDVSSLTSRFNGWLDRSLLRDSEFPIDMPAFFVAAEGGGPTLASSSAATVMRIGLKAEYVAELSKLLGFERKNELSKALKTNGTSLWRLEKEDKPLPSASAEQILRIMQLQLLATEVFGTVDAARGWLDKPHPLLDGLSPSNYADNQFGAEQVHDLLIAIKYGGAA